MFGNTGFIHENENKKAEQQDDVCVQFPAVLVEGHLVHVYQEDNDWYVWLNTQDMEFTGLCIGVGDTREAAIAQAAGICHAVVSHLQKLP